MPASARRSRVASGSASSNDTSVVSPRGATVRPASSRRAASRAASEVARSWTVGPAVRRQDVVGGERAGDRLGADARRVVATGVGVQLGGQAVAGVLEVHVGGAHRRHARLPLGRHPQHPAADRPAHPLLAGARVEGASERRRRRNRSRRRPGRRPAGPACPATPARKGARQPVVQLTCEQATSLVRGPTASARSANGTARMSTPAPRAQRDQRSEQAGVLVGRGQHLVAGPQLHPRQDAHDAVARARGQGDVGDIGPERPPRTRRAGGRAARSTSRRTPSRGPTRRRGPGGRGSLARTRAAAARRCRRSGRPDPRGRGTRRAGRRHPPAAGYLPAADRPGRGARAGVEHGRAAILLGLGRRRRVAAAADARPRPVVELVLAAEGPAAAERARVAARLARSDRSKHAGDRRRRERRRSCAGRGCRTAGSGARGAGAPVTTRARGARRRGAPGGGPGAPCAAPGAAPRARPGAGPAPRRSGCAVRAGWGRGLGHGPRRPGRRRQGRRSRRTRRTRPTASWASSSKSRPAGAARERARCARGSALSGSSEREPCRGDLLHESAGARPAQRHGAVGYQAPCDPARRMTVAARHERSFASAPKRRCGRRSRSIGSDEGHPP